MQPINLGIEESPKIIHVAQSLSTEEKAHFAKFFQDKKINFTWTYSNMSGLDTNLIMHHCQTKIEKDASTCSPIGQRRFGKTLECKLY